MPSTPNEADLFECRMCGDCCNGYGGTYVTEADIERIAAYIGSDPSIVRSRFCRMSGSRPLLAQGKDGYCIFWDRVCTIHPVKPLMCRRWPYIPGVLADPSNWRAMAGSCPGIHADAPLSLVQETVRRKLAAETAGEEPSREDP
ncbi:MAG: YkgJ family cysteine cluster protein [Desulfobacterales bacterium]|jgi:Fe-S-cluster containining protein